ncbi:MAG: hypothetical protein R2713_10325 [Ilumatobacteraceae bacterium]
MAAIAVGTSPLAFETFAATAAELLPAVISQRRDDHARRTPAARPRDRGRRRTGVAAPRRVLMLERRVADGGVPTAFDVDEDDQHPSAGHAAVRRPRYGSAWSHPMFLPPRVGTLVPLRIAALLGEDITAARRAS